MKSTVVSLFTMVLASSLHAEPLTQSTFTELVRNVDVLVQPANTAEPAKLNEVFRAPNLLRTGPNSRAELTAPDDTITRVGANTIFSFAPTGREINLEQGSVLFHSPNGKGGGVIKSGGATAAVTGTTVIVSTAPGSKPDNSGFKVILLEGRGLVKLKSGKSRRLKAGELIYVLPDHDDFGPLLNINLAKLVAGSGLVKGFSQDLPSEPLIEAAMVKQQKLITTGKAWDTGRNPDRYFSDPLPPGGGSHNGPNYSDPNTFQYSIYNSTINTIVSGNVPTGTTPNIPGLPLITYQTYYTSVFGITPIDRTEYTYNPAVASSAFPPPPYPPLPSSAISGNTTFYHDGSGGYSKTGIAVFVPPDVLSPVKVAPNASLLSTATRITPPMLAK